MKGTISGMVMLLSTLLFSCKPNEADAPVTAAKAFYTALSSMDFKKAADFATTDSKTVLELLESLSGMGSQIDLPKETFDKMKSATFGNATIDNNVASVPVKIGNETTTILLKKEEGAWKVAFDKDSLQELMPETKPDKGNATVPESR